MLHNNTTPLFFFYTLKQTKVFYLTNTRSKAQAKRFVWDTAYFGVDAFSSGAAFCWRKLGMSFWKLTGFMLHSSNNNHDEIIKKKVFLYYKSHALRQTKSRTILLTVSATPLISTDFAVISFWASSSFSKSTFTCTQTQTYHTFNTHIKTCIH